MCAPRCIFSVLHSPGVACCFAAICHSLHLCVGKARVRRHIRQGLAPGASVCFYNAKTAEQGVARLRFLSAAAVFSLFSAKPLAGCCNPWYGVEHAAMCVCAGRGTLTAALVSASEARRMSTRYTRRRQTRAAASISPTINVFLHHGRACCTRLQTWGSRTVLRSFSRKSSSVFTPP